MPKTSIQLSLFKHPSVQAIPIAAIHLIVIIRAPRVKAVAITIIALTAIIIRHIIIVAKLGIGLVPRIIGMHLIRYRRAIESVRLPHPYLKSAVFNP